MSKVNYINLVAPVFTTKYRGTEGRLVNWLDSKEGKDFGVKYNIADLRQNLTGKLDLIKLVDDCYDATIVFKGEMLTPEILERCSRPRVLYFPDDILIYPNYAKFIKYIGHCYDIVYTFDREAIPTFHTLGCKNVKWMPSWTGDDLFYDKKLERDIDVSFVGSFNEYRIKMMNTVKYYFKDKHLCFKEGVYGDEYVNLLNRSKVVINAAQGLVSGVSQRIFEATACNALVITNYCEELFLLFNKDQIISWKTLEEMIKLLNFYLDNDNIREDIAMRGFTQTIGNHLVQHRFRKMIADIEEWKIKNEN